MIISGGFSSFLDFITIIYVHDPQLWKSWVGGWVKGSVGLIWAMLSWLTNPAEVQFNPFGIPKYTFVCLDIYATIRVVGWPIPHLPMAYPSPTLNPLGLGARRPELAIGFGLRDVRLIWATVQ